MGRGRTRKLGKKDNIWNKEKYQQITVLKASKCHKHHKVQEKNNQTSLWI